MTADPSVALGPSVRAADAPPSPASAIRVRRRRRPSGKPPALPRQLHASGKRWLLLVGGVVVAWFLIDAVQPTAVVRLDPEDPA